MKCALQSRARPHWHGQLDIAAASEDSIELDVDVLILIVAAEQGYRLAAGSADRKASNSNELGLLQADRVIACASARRALQQNLPRLRGGIGLDDDSVDLGGTWKIVLAGDRELFRISPTAP